MKKIALVNPSENKNNLSRLKFYDIPQYNLQLLKALTPKEKFNVDIVDESKGEKIDYRKYDLAGITILTTNADRGYKISTKFRNQGTKTILGGVHPSMMPQEAKKYADSVLIGEAEEKWEMVLQDFDKGKLKQFYMGGKANPQKIPVIKQFTNGNYFVERSIQTTRGCPNNCDFCSVASFNGNKIRQRSIEDILEEYDSLREKLFLFADDNLIPNSQAKKNRVKTIFEKMKERNSTKLWAAQTDLSISDPENDEIRKLSYDAGARLYVIGFESLTEKGLKSRGKGINISRGPQTYKERIKRIQNDGISVVGMFILGHDDDNQDSIKRLRDFILDSNVDIPQFSILTPLPGTRLFKRMQEQGRLRYKNFPEDWKHFDVAHCTFYPKNFDPDELEETIFRLYEQTSNFPKSLVAGFKNLSRTKNPFSAFMTFNMRYQYYKGFKEEYQQMFQK